MYLTIGDVLSEERLQVVADVLREPAHYRPGGESAGGLARQVKHNLQARGGNRVDAALAMVAESLLEHPLLRSAARPRKLVRIMANCFQPGMEYGNHVDEPVIDGERTDLSFTLALSDPRDYEGGDLVIETDAGMQRFRLAAGELLLYPAHTLHRVEPVRSGARFCVVGWLRSWIADAAQREVLFDLDRVLDALVDAAAPPAVVDRLQRARGRLVRMWAA